MAEIAVVPCDDSIKKYHLRRGLKRRDVLGHKNRHVFEDITMDTGMSKVEWLVPKKWAGKDVAPELVIVGGELGPFEVSDIESSKTLFYGVVVFVDGFSNCIAIGIQHLRAQLFHAAIVIHDDPTISPEGKVAGVRVGMNGL